MKILSEGSFREFDGFELIGEKETLNLEFGGTSIECTDDHEFLREDGEWVEAKDIEVGEKYNGYSLVKKSSTHTKQRVYDAINVKDTHSFYAEGLTAHNCSFLYIDETAFVEKWDEFFASVFPTISSGKTTKILLTSTPNGLNHFYKTCEGAKEEKNGYIYIEVPWWRVPGRDEKWKQETLQGIDFDMEKFRQEFEAQFLGSSGTLIEGSKLKELVIRTPIYESNNISMYEKPQENHTYVLIADVSRGKGLDYSAFSVIDVTSMPYKQVVAFRDNMITPIDYSEIIHRISKNYNDAYVLVEVNDIGEQVTETLHFDFEVETLLYTERAGSKGKRISGGFGRNVDKGIRTTKSVKAIGCNMLKMLIEQDQLIVNDFNTINELSTFSRKGVSYEAEPGAHDDHVMGLVLFGWLTDQSFFKEITDINTMMKLKQKSEEELVSDLTPFGFNMDDLNEPDVEIPLPGGGSWMDF
jgi:hypothetical protein